MTSPEDAKKMIDEVVNKAKGLADSQLKGLPKLVDKFMLSERQIVKKNNIYQITKIIRC